MCHECDDLSRLLLFLHSQADALSGECLRYNVLQSTQISPCVLCKAIPARNKPAQCCLQDTKAAKETQALQAFYDMMARDSARAFYGPGHVQAAHELGAVQTLLITDTLFRVNNIAQV